MDAYKAISSRRTIRDFKQRHIENDVLERLLGAGLYAPSNDHLRNWEFIVVNDLAVRENMISAIEEMTSDANIEELLKEWNINEYLQKQMYIYAIPRQKTMLQTAGCLILPLYRQEAALLQPRTLSSLNAFASIWCCIENVLIAATAEGIFGVTQIPSQNEVEHIKTLMKIPKEYEVACYLALGYPSENAEPVKQYEYKITDKIHRNCW
jgi:nitroreductase